MKRVFVILLFFIPLSQYSCSHDTSELEKPKDIISSDIPTKDISSQDYITDNLLTDTNETDGDYLEIKDILTDYESEETYPDILPDVPDDGSIIPIDIMPEEIEDKGYPDIEDIDDTLLDVTDDTISLDIECKSECEKVGEKKCVKIDDKEYISECKDLNNDSCYEWINIEFCKYGCSNAQCKPCEPDCNNKDCGDNGCGGNCGICNHPPQNMCKDSETLIEYMPNGECIDNKCYYPYNEIKCQYGCKDNACQGCTPKCENKNCGPDGCGGVCPPSCSELQFCNPNGICECLYETCNGVCCDIDAVCYQGACCIPDCFNKECGPDKCGGSCGNCEPPATCKQGICQ